MGAMRTLTLTIMTKSIQIPMHSIQKSKLWVGPTSASIALNATPTGHYLLYFTYLLNVHYSLTLLLTLQSTPSLAFQITSSLVPSASSICRSCRAYLPIVRPIATIYSRSTCLITPHHHDGAASPRALSLLAVEAARAAVTATVPRSLKPASLLSSAENTVLNTRGPAAHTAIAERSEARREPRRI